MINENEIDIDDELQEEPEGALEDDQEIIDNLISNDDVQVTGWKRIFLLPYDPVWMFAVFSIGYTCSLLSLYNAGFSLYHATEGNLFDFLQDIIPLSNYVYLFNIVLTIGDSIFVGKGLNDAVGRTPVWVTIFDLISVLPLEVFVDTTTPITRFRAKLYYIVQLTQLFKLVRFTYVFYNFNIIIYRKDDLYAVEYFAIVLFMIVIGTSVTYIIECYNEENDCPSDITLQSFQYYFQMSLFAYMGTSYADFPDNVVWMVVFNILKYTFYLCCTCTIISLIVTKVTVSYWNKFLFLSTLELMKMHLVKYRVSQDISAKCIAYYIKFWKRRKVYDNTNIELQLSALPEVMQQELSLDISWIVFKHSQIFCNMDIPFLRYISQYFKSIYMLPGEILYDKDVVKSHMVYVISGVVQITSEEDGDTPVLSFSGGTCLGEYSLVLNLKPNTNVYCKTYCLIKVLYKKEFIQVSRRYPEQYRQILAKIGSRIQKSKELVTANMSEYTKTDRKDQITMQWLKSSLHKCMITQNDETMNHQCQNIFLRHEFSEDKFKTRKFCYDNLAMLAISERLELVTETVLLKSSCPCILQPSSLIIDIWKSIVSIAAIYISIITPFFAFVQPITPLWYKSSIYIVTLVWWLDLYMQLSTAIKTDKEFITTMNGLFLYKIGTLGFLADILAAIPLEIFSSITLSHVSGQTHALLHLNRSLKTWHALKLMRKWENKQHELLIVFRYLNFFCILTYLSYIASCFLFATNCFEGDCVHEIADGSILIQLIYNTMSSSQAICATGILNVYDMIPLYFPIVTALTAIAKPFYLYVVGSLAAAYSLHKTEHIRYVEHCTAIQEIVRAFDLHNILSERMFNFKRVQWVFHGRIKTHQYDTVFSNIPQYIYSSIKRSIYLRTFKQVDLLKELPEAFLVQASLAVDGFVIPANEVLCYAGKITDEFYIIERGMCKYVSSTEGVPDIMLRPNATLLLIEAFMNIPAVYSVVTVTDCRILSINRQRFLKIYNVLGLHRGEIVEILRDLNAYHHLATTSEPIANYCTFKDTHQKKIPSFYTFGYNLRVDSMEEYDYYIPFDRALYISWLRFILLRYTIIPEGRFFFIWEVIRCICAFSSAILFSIVYTRNCDHCIWRYLRLFLDIMAWIDIYIRLHVCYYNKDGLRICHPLKTAVHYLKRSFIIDLLGSFPINKFLAMTRRTNIDIKLNRVLQMHRVIGFSLRLNKDSVFNTATQAALSYIPILAVVTVACGSSLTTLMCDFSVKLKRSDAQQDDVSCQENSYIYQPMFLKPISPIRLEIYSMYITASLITTIGMSGFIIHTSLGALFANIMNIVSYFLSVHITSVILAHNTILVPIINNYQNQITSLNQFQSIFHIPRELCHQLLCYYELYWQRNHGTDVQGTLKCFNTALKKDVLFDIYGERLFKRSIFGSDSLNFCRDLSMNVSHNTICNGTFVTVVNTVEKTLYLIYGGNAAVIAPDGTVLATLSPGSIFGNLDNFEWSRQTISVQADGHIDILTIDSLKFHNILSKHPSSHRKYKALTAFHSDYLASQVGEFEQGDSKFDHRKVSLLNRINCFKYSRQITSKVFDYQSKTLRIWRCFIFFVVCYLGVSFDLYQLALREFSIPFIIFQYFCDFTYLINYYVSTHTNFVNRGGFVVNDIGLIRNRNRKTKVLFYLNIVSLFQLDVFAWFFPNGVFQISYCILRFNRILRLHNVIRSFQGKLRSIHTNQFLTRICFILAWSTFLLHMCTCILITIGCTHTPNMFPEITCNRDVMSVFEKLLMYSKFSYIIVGIFVRSCTGNFFPNSVQLIVFFTALMIILYVAGIIFLAQVYTAFLLVYLRRNFLNLRLNQILQYMLYEGASTALSTKIENYMKRLSKLEKGQNYPTILENAPKYLRELVLNAAFGHHLENNFVFSKCHTDFKRQVVGCFKNTVYLENDYVVYQGTLDDSMYFIHSGTLVAISEESHSTETIAGKLMAGMCFGIAQGVLQQTPHLYSYRCESKSVIVSLQRKEWNHLLYFFPASQFEIFSRLQSYVEKYD